jgi:GNAT superfamily N-acetyltransferase
VDVLSLPPTRFEELRAFLAKDPIQNTYALGVLEEHRTGGPGGAAVTYHALLEGEQLAGVAVVAARGGLVLPCVADPSGALKLGQSLADKVKLRSALGERGAVDALLRGLACGQPRLSRLQRLFAASADDLGPFVCPELRAAEPADLPQLIALAAASIQEAFGEDPLQADARAFARRVAVRAAAGRTFIYSEAGKVLVKIDVGARSRHGAELEGLFTLPTARRRGLATNVLGQLARTTLGAIPRIIMRVDEKDAALAAVCRKVGMLPKSSQRMVVVG